jgi:protein-S-isoprenylcysteine O-methyltransferase Ste14
MIIPILATIVRALWLFIEVPYLRRYKVKSAKDWDKRSAGLWDFANAIEPIGMILGFTNIGRIQTGRNLIGPIGLALLLGGIAIRWTAIYTLGKYFTPKVVIQDEHQLIRAGLYQHVRHPAYAGTLLAHLGLGLSFSNWFSLTLSFVPYVVAALYRMQVEELALRETLGEEYVYYSRKTKRLIPRVY